MKNIFVGLSLVLCLNTDYIDQQDTAYYNQYSCLPTCVEMALDNYGVEFNRSDFMKNNYSNGGTSVSSVKKELDLIGVKYKDELIFHTEDIIEELESGNYVIFMFDTSEMFDFMNRSDATRGIYHGRARHSVLIKGFDGLSFVVDDPFSMGRNYEGKPIGKNILIPKEVLESVSSSSFLVLERSKNV